MELIRLIIINLKYKCYSVLFFFIIRYNNFTFSATDWRTIQGGLNRLPQGFEPVLGDKVEFGIKVNKLAIEKNGQVSVQWKDKLYDQEYRSRNYDNVIISVPFTIVRNWHLPGMCFYFQDFYIYIFIIVIILL